MDDAVKLCIDFLRIDTKIELSVLEHEEDNFLMTKLAYRLPLFEDV